MEATAIIKKATGIPGFDIIAHGGLPAGSTTLVGGTPGSGKTIFAVQFLAQGILDVGEPGVFVTFEERPHRLRRYMASFGWNIPAWEQANQLAFVDISPRPDDPHILEAGAFDFGGLVTRIEHAVRKIKAQRVSLDSISTVFTRFRDPRLVRYELFRLAESLREMGITSILTAERSSENFEAALEDFVADNVIVLRNRLEEEKRRRTIEILKFRGTSHQKGEYPFTVSPQHALIVIPLTEMRMEQKSTAERITSGIKELDDMCGSGFFRDSIILVTGATGCGKTLVTTQFVQGAARNRDRALVFGFEESHDQLFRNARGWSIDFDHLEQEGLLHVVCTYPEVHSLEDHLIHIKQEVETYQPNRVVMDSLSALERVSTRKGFREFVVALTCYLKEKQITGMFTLATPSLLGGESVTENHISSIADSIILLRYVELFGEMRRGITVLKMRGSQHEKNIRQFTIDSQGMHIGKAFRNVTGILTGNLTHTDHINDDRLDEVL